MIPLKVLIIDDESKIRFMISEIVNSYCNEAKVIGQAGSVKEGLKMISALSPDLVLLDIKMDDGTGFDLLEKLNKVDFRIIFITAFQEHALKAIKFSALDYLLKPINPEELINAVNDAGQTIAKTEQLQLNHLSENFKGNDNSEKKILLKTATNIHLVQVSEIIYCEADGGYTNFYTDREHKILVSSPLAVYEELLLDYGFYRLHKSYLVNLHKVQRFEKEDGGFVVLNEGLKVPVASRKKDQLLLLLEKLTQ